MNESLSRIIAQELSVKPQQVLSAITLLDEGNTVPFCGPLPKRGNWWVR
ncbi:transcription accessory protein [Proteus mirabilis]|uniref:Transcription accessory protein n=1 Tax=Proteus mirabilis TaxID=584 RepID=A0A2X2C6K4_PROMI|nr:transcription accessory protein [Proteus mirabilis]